MRPELIVLMVASLLAVMAVRLLPRGRGTDVASGIAAATLLLISWHSAAWLGCGIALSQWAMWAGDRFQRRTVWFGMATSVHVVLLFLLRDLPTVTTLGGAYFSLRHIHVLSDWWAGRLLRPTTRAYLQYHLFLPTLVAGPIHRFAPFQSQLLRRRNDPEDMVAGAERLLWGAFQFTVLGGWLMNRVNRAVAYGLADAPGSALDLAQSACGWITLYLGFAGLSSIAIGLSLMMGLRIEENFDQPWKARDLLDFWSRWHMTLTSFSRDYIFRPVSAMTRSAVAGAFITMVFLGLWHGLSAYWIGWGIWQGLGVLLTSYARGTGLFASFPVWSGRLFAAFWLLCTMPVVTGITGVSP